MKTCSRPTRLSLVPPSAPLMMTQERQLRAKLKELRDREDAIQKLQELAPKVAKPHTRRAYEAANLQLAGTLVSRSALAREESRGAHYRIDYPDHDDKKFLKHSVVKGDTVRFL